MVIVPNRCTPIGLVPLATLLGMVGIAAPKRKALLNCRLAFLLVNDADGDDPVRN
jgi:hypothetical protein